MPPQCKCAGGRLDIDPGPLRGTGETRTWCPRLESVITHGMCNSPINGGLAGQQHDMNARLSIAMFDDIYYTYPHK